jgi:hypothetical protein
MEHKMPWIRIDDNLFLHPKWLQISPSARGLWITALSYCGNQSNGGVVPYQVLPILAGTVEDAQALVDVGLWETGEQCWTIHDFAEYNDASTPDAKVQRNDKRSAAARQAGLASAAKRQRSTNERSTFDQRFVNERSTISNDDPTISNEGSTNGQRNSTNGQRFSTPSPSPSPSPRNEINNDHQVRRGLTARPRVSSIETELDRPARLSETDRRVARALELASKAWDDENEQDRSAIDRVFDEADIPDNRKLI